MNHIYQFPNLSVGVLTYKNPPKILQRKLGLFAYIFTYLPTLQIFTGHYRDFTGKFPVQVQGLLVYRHHL